MKELKKLLVSASLSTDSIIKLWESRGWHFIDSEPSLVPGTNILTFKHDAR